jgi:4-diphosphocytidyl-2-C-methyl-D-erythritol kinase
MDKYIISAPAKINITLDVLSKREDGYHNIKSIMQTIDLCDEMTIEKIQEGIQVQTNLPYLPRDSRNTAYKAAEEFFDYTNIKNQGVKISIAKKIPVSAGLAGGSANAAAVIKSMNIIFDTGLSASELTGIGRKIGADVPFCIMGGTALCEGIGDILTPLPDLPDMVLVIAKPPISVSTAKVYGSLRFDEEFMHPDTERILKYIDEGDTVAIAKNMYNVLEPITTNTYKIINRIKNIMLGAGALGAVMSGSGPTVFAVFENKINAIKCIEKLKIIVKDTFITGLYKH